MSSLSQPAEQPRPRIEAYDKNQALVTFGPTPGRPEGHRVIIQTAEPFSDQEVEKSRRVHTLRKAITERAMNTDNASVLERVLAEFDQEEQTS